MGIWRTTRPTALTLALRIYAVEHIKSEVKSHLNSKRLKTKTDDTVRTSFGRLFPSYILIIPSPPPAQNL